MALVSGDAEGALKIAQEGAARFTGARALVHLQAEAMLALRDYGRAVSFLEEQLALERSDRVAWRLMAKALEGLGRTAQAHRASAEAYVLDGAWLAAIEQLQLARKAGGLDFYAASQLDVRIKELQALHTREQEEARSAPR